MSGTLRARLARTVLAVAAIVAVAHGAWETKVRVENNGAVSSFGINNARCVATAGDTIHVVWHDARGSALEVYYNRSTDLGLTWEVERPLTANDNFISANPSISVVGDTLHAIWHDSRVPPQEIYHRRSTDGGTTWSGETNLSNNAAVSYLPCIASSGSTVHAVWTDSGQVRYRRSTDNGANWVTDTRLNSGTAGTIYSSVAVTGAAVHVVWRDGRDGHSEIYYARSTDNGANWSTDRRVSSNDVYESHYPSVAASGTLVHVVWRDYRDTDYEVYYTRSTDGGQNWETDRRLTNNAGQSMYPSVTADRDVVHVVWDDDRGGTRRVYYKHSVDGGQNWDASDTPLEATLSASAYAAAFGPAVRVVWTDGSYIYHRRDPVGNTSGDVGCSTIEAPSGVVPLGAVITPSCQVYNYGVTTVSYDVRMKIGTSYNQAVAAVLHAPGTSRRITFPGWTASAPGTHAVVCSTELYADADETNDSLLRSVIVEAYDVGCTSIEAPVGTVPPSTVVTPACQVYNYGTATASYNVRMEIGTTYNQAVPVTSHAPGTSRRVTFPDWTAGAAGTYAVVCSTELATDYDLSNDSLLRSVIVDAYDVEARRIDNPVWLVQAGNPVTPRATVRNNSIRPIAAATVFFLIDDPPVYSQRLTPSLASGQELTLDFPVWTATAGPHTARCSVYLAGDDVTGNDVVSQRFTCPWFPPDWAEGASMPLGSGKGIGDGGWVVRKKPKTDGPEYAFAAKGNKTGEFYKYDILGDSWLVGASIPAGREGKLPGKGCKAAADSGDYVYMVKGNNTQGFWRYSVAGDSWKQMPDIPLGSTNKRVKAGSDLAFVDYGGQQYVYFLKGQKDEFWRFKIQGDSWEPLQGVPVSLPAIKTNAGSWIELVESGTDAGPYIYLHKSKFHHLHRYDLSTESWETGLLPGMPFVGRSGRSKKSKDGGSAATFDGRIYALKGGNTCEFWRYTPAGDSWFELDPIPEIGSSGKKKRVKNGADIVSLGEGSFFVTKGNKTVECWRVAVAETDADLTRPGVLASGIRREASGVLRVSPNPLRSGFATLQVNSQWSGSPARVSIFDASGRCVLSSSFGIRTSSLPLDLRSMQAGVYLLKLESGSRTTTQKLVIQR